MKPMFSRYALSALMLFGAMFLVPEAKAQPYGGFGWCPTTGCDGSMNVSGPFGACPGNSITCPISGQGCMMGQSGTCCSGSSPQDYSWYSYVCESSGGGGGGGGGGGTTGVSPTLSYSCNATNSTATLSWSGGSTAGGQYALRINDTTAPPPPPASTWSGACPAASPDFCGDVTGSSRSMNVVLGRRYDAWIHSYDSMCGSFGCSYAPTAVPTSVSFVCSPPPPPAPTVTFWADPSNVSYNGTSLLKWTSTNATSCTAIVSAPYTNWNSGGAPNNVSGISTGPLTANQTYGLRCAGAGGPIDAFATVTVGAPVLPPDPTGLTATCLAPNQVRLSWNPVLGFGVTGYAFRADYATPSWDGKCTSPDECSGIAASSYDKAVTPGITYDWWVHACNGTGCSPGIHGPNFKCDYPASTISGRITNQATGAGIPGVVIPACAANPGAITDASGNYSFTVPYDARFCIRPNTPVGMNSNPLLSGLQPSQQAIHSYEWQVAGWNAGVHPLCDNFDDVNNIPPSCDYWKQWDRAVDTGYDFVYSPDLPTPSLVVCPSSASIALGQTKSDFRAWYRSNGTSITCSSLIGSDQNVTSSAMWVSGDSSRVEVVAKGSLKGVAMTGSDVAVTVTYSGKSAITQVGVICSPDPTCGGTRSNTCTNKKCTDVCGNEYSGAKDCREFWKEVAP